jgi:small subunit ribosomal protein S2
LITEHIAGALEEALSERKKDKDDAKMAEEEEAKRKVDQQEA